MNIDYTAINIVVIVVLAVALAASLRRLDSVSRKADYLDRKLHQSKMWAEKLSIEHRRMIEANVEQDETIRKLKEKLDKHGLSHT